MTALPEPDAATAVDGVTVQIQASPTGRGVWNVFDPNGFIGTLAESHPYRPTPNPQLIARRPVKVAPVLYGDWETAIRFLLASEP